MSRAREIHAVITEDTLRELHGAIAHCRHYRHEHDLSTNENIMLAVRREEAIARETVEKVLTILERRGPMTYDSEVLESVDRMRLAHDRVKNRQSAIGDRQSP